MNARLGMSEESLAVLRNLLAKRVEIIADHAFRDRDPASHLGALKNVSEQIDAFRELHWDKLDARLRHFLTNASYQKALEWVDRPTS